MKNLVVKILSLLCFVCICFAFASCDDKTVYDNLKDDGNFITVTYNPNGGRILMRKEMSYIDMFNPSKIQKSADGTVHIKLLSLESSLRSTQDITPAKNGYFCAGWYRTRTPEKKIIENVEYFIDEAGNALVLNDNDEYVIKLYKRENGYVAAESGKETVSTPVYNYADRWDFEKDELVYYESENKLGVYNGEKNEIKYLEEKNYDVTLYAAWIKNYTFEYYNEETVGSETKWVKGGASSGFDYMFVNSGKDGSEDLDTIYLPYWNYNENNQKTGGMFYSGDRDKKQTIPKKSGTTFYKAYTDEACTEEIATEKIKHSGTVNFENATAVDPVQKIYVKTTPGEDYYIDTVEQFTENASLTGNYYIRNDLVFTKDASWPATFTQNEFKGKIISEVSSGVTFSGIDVTVSAKANGGLFGIISSNAEISGISFKDVNVYMSSIAPKGNYGLLAGMIAENAKLTNVSINGSLRLNGETDTKTDGDRAALINLYANTEAENALAGVTKGEVKLYFCGAKNRGDTYRYNIEIGSGQVDENYKVTYKYHALTEDRAESESLEYPKASA